MGITHNWTATGCADGCWAALAARQTSLGRIYRQTRPTWRICLLYYVYFFFLSLYLFLWRPTFLVVRGEKAAIGRTPEGTDRAYRLADGRAVLSLRYQLLPPKEIYGDLCQVPRIMRL